MQRARDAWNRDGMKQLDVINKRLPEKNEARACINNVDEAMPEYYQVFAKQIKPQLSDFYHPSNIQLLFVAVSTGLAT